MYYFVLTMGVVNQKFDVLVTSLHEDLEKDLVSWTHINSTSTRKLAWPTLIISSAALNYFHPH